MMDMGGSMDQASRGARAIREQKENAMSHPLDDDPLPDPPRADDWNEVYRRYDVLDAPGDDNIISIEPPKPAPKPMPKLPTLISP